MLRSNFLLHWTGNDLHSKYAALDDGVRRRYVDRLYDIIANGFWMTLPPEQLTGGAVRSPGAEISFKYQAAMTCFTEIRLSDCRHHSYLYGRLGIAVDRRFVLDRWGGPVHYVRNHRDEHVIAAFIELRNQLANKANMEVAKKQAKYIGAFFKGMSHATKDDFSFLEELEWRIVATEEQIKNGNIADTGQTKPPFKIKLAASDVKLIVLPDARTRKMATEDDRMKTLSGTRRMYPPILTIRDCTNF